MAANRTESSFEVETAFNISQLEQLGLRENSCLRDEALLFLAMAIGDSVA
jgi:hypothetical protein